MLHGMMGGKDGMDELHEKMKGMQEGKHSIQDLLNSKAMKQMQEHMKTDKGKDTMKKLGDVMQNKMKDLDW